MTKNTEIDLLNSDESENYPSNTSSNRPFSDVLEANISRRKLLKGGTLAVAGATFISPAVAAAKGNAYKGFDSKQPLMNFTALTTEEVVAAEGKTVSISSDYEYQVLIPWGTPIDPNSNVSEYKGDPSTRPTAEEAEQQVGLGHDGMWFFPANQNLAVKRDMNVYRRIYKMTQRKQFKQFFEENPKFVATLKKSLLGKTELKDNVGYLCVNHEFARNSHGLGKSAPESLEDVRLSQALHGASVVAIRKNSNGQWKVESNQNSRRITVNTPVTFSGPAAGSALLENAANNAPQGTVNNCGAGHTPWGTYITCEENFNGYFGSNAEFTPTDAQARYGLSSFGFGYNWFKFDERFDLTNPNYANESNRFGWCVEINPFDGSEMPVKRTALGRVKHEAIAFIPEKIDERAICYMGDDQRGDYCYKYVSNKAWRDHLLEGESPLDHGTLYVARFDEGDDNNDGMGTGVWLELSMDNPLLSAKFSGIDEILINTRVAADIAGATPMDRPEWTTTNMQGEVFWTFTNNDRKDDGQGAISEANPVFENKDGHIIKTIDTSDTTFTWDIFMLARNTRRPDDEGRTDSEFDLPYAAYTAPADGGANVFTDPDAIYADGDGRVFIGTDGGQPDGLQDQLVVVDSKTGEYRRLLSGVASDEITGIAPTPSQGTLFTNTQHPGNGSPSNTNFPAEFDGVTIPRDCTIVITKKDGGKVGS